MISLTGSFVPASGNNEVGGAWLWDHYHNYQIPFWVGVGIACVSLVATRWLPRDAEPGPHHIIVPEIPPQEEVPAIVEA